MNPQDQNPHSMAEIPMSHHPRHNAWLPWTILIVVVIAALAVLGIVFSSKLFPSTSSAEKLSGYQAVFLTNGQVYFGKISDINDQYVKLHDIYYLQENQQIQPDQNGTTGSSSSAAAAAAAANSSSSTTPQQLSLVKLGNELHGPADAMSINRDQILFYEDMKQNSQVYQAILKYQQTGGSSSAQTPASGTPTGGTPASGTPASGTPATGTNNQQAPATTTPAASH